MTSKYKNYIWLVFGLIFILIHFPVTAANTDKLIIRGSDNYPPFEYINQDREPEGFNVDIIKALMKELDYDYELKLDNWDKIIHDLQNNQINLIIGMIYSAERTAYGRFSLPTCVITRNFITRKHDNYHSIDDLKGKEIIVEKGGWFHKYLLKNQLAGKIIESDDIYKSLKLLKSGEHDAILTGELIAHYAINQLNIKDLEINDMGIAPQNYSIVVNPNNDELLYQINIGLQHLKSSGIYDQIYNKWFGIYESQKTSRSFLIVLAIFLSIAFLLLLFVWLLRRQVKRATRLFTDSKQEIGIAIDAGKISAWMYNGYDRIVRSLHGHPIFGPQNHIDKIYDMIHPSDVKIVHNEFQFLLSKKKKETEVSFRIRENDDSPYLYYETKMMYVEATKKQPCCIIGTLKDVTTEQFMKMKLEDYRIKSKFITSTNDIVLLEYDIISQTFTPINEDENLKEITLTIAQYMARVHPEDIKIVNKYINELNSAENYEIFSEHRILSEDNTYNWYTVNAVAYKYDEDGDITSYIGLRQNNNKWKKITNDLIALREKAEASNKLKSAFLANMSHEIRTPLNAIIGFSELILTSEDEQEKAEFVDIVKTNNGLLLQLINDVLDLSKIESGYINFEYSDFDFSFYFQELATSLRLKESRNVKLICINKYTELKTYSDKNRITQIITNFVNNAFKFTREGSVTLEYEYENEGIKISVTDTGIGIAQENLSRIFGRFEKINDFAQGTGLGLPICKTIAEALQGQIGVESIFGSGSTFWFWLPCNASADTQHPEKNNYQRTGISDNTPQTTPGLLHLRSETKKTILIAEDLDNNYTIIHSILKEDYHVIRATNGIEAVDFTKIHKPDMILMDMKMPVMDGLYATKEIRKFNPQVPIIALTAYVFDTNRQDALRAGCNELITKPLNKDVLMTTIHHCI